MKKLILLLFLVFFLAVPSFPQEYRANLVYVEEEDGSPSTVTWKLKTANDSLTINPDGTVSLDSDAWDHIATQDIELGGFSLDGDGNLGFDPDNDGIDELVLPGTGIIPDGNIPSGITRDSEWDTIGEIETATGVNIILNTEIDTFSELNTLVADKTLVNLEDGISKVPTETKTDDYTITTSDFGKSLRMNSTSDKTFYLPSVGASDDGARITLVKINTGKVTIDAADTDIIDNSGAGDTIYNNQISETYANLTLEYVDANTTWIIIGGRGTWTPTD